MTQPENNTEKIDTEEIVGESGSSNVVVMDTAAFNRYFLQKSTLQSPERFFELVGGGAAKGKPSIGTPRLTQWQANFVNGVEELQANNPSKARVKFFAAVQEAEKKAPPGEHAISLCGVAYFYAAIQQYVDAQNQYRKALEMWLKIHGREDPNLSLFLNDLALTYEAQGNYKEAENWFDKAASILKRIFGTEDERTLEVLSRQADTFIGIGRHSVAQRYFKKILEIREKNLHPNHTAIIATLYDLSKTYRSIKKPKDAEEFDKRWIPMFLSANNSDYKRASNLLNQLGELNFAKKNFLMAEFLYRKSLEFLEHVAASPNADTVDPLYWLAESLREQNRYDEAVEVVDKSIALIGKLALDTHTLGLAYFCKAKINLETGNKDVVDDFFKKALTVFEKREHPSKLLILIAYSSFLQDNKKQDEANALKESITQLEKSLRQLTT